MVVQGGVSVSLSKSLDENDCLRFRSAKIYIGNDKSIVHRDKKQSIDNGV